LAKALREPLLKVFPPALLGRLVTIPYYPLSDEMIGEIVRLQLGRVEKRILDNHKVPFSYDDEVVKLMVSRCTELESGGRMVDAILTNTVLPAISAGVPEPDHGGPAGGASAGAGAGWRFCLPVRLKGCGKPASGDV
jgi:ATP-dependent Clp protease ATP-binding subunit ClpA